MAHDESKPGANVQLDLDNEVRALETENANLKRMLAERGLDRERVLHLGTRGIVIPGTGILGP